MIDLAACRRIEARNFKWPQRPHGITSAWLLGEDGFGAWIGVTKGDPWWWSDGSRSGVFLESLVKLVPHATFWTACFNPGEPQVDVDISLPVRWQEDGFAEVDLELDVLRSAAGAVTVRDRDKFERVRAEWPMPDEIGARAEAACAQIQELLARGAEPFGSVGRQWLDRFLTALAARPADQPVRRR
jgi:hypothetical protein